MADTIERRASYGVVRERVARFPSDIARTRSYGQPIERVGGYFTEVSAPADYFATVQSTLGAANIVAHYRLDETSGTTAADATGNGYTGTYTNGPTLGATSLLTSGGGTSVDFDGVNDYVDLGNAGQWDFLTTAGVYTVNLWHDFQAIDGALDMLFGNSISSGSAGIGLGYDMRAPDELRFYDFPGDGSIGIVGAAAPAAGVHMISVTVDGSTARLYVDAVEVASALINLGVAPPNNLILGAVGGATSLVTPGRIDEVTIANVTATPAQISALYAYGTA